MHIKNSPLHLLCIFHTLTRLVSLDLVNKHGRHLEVLPLCCMLQKMLVSPCMTAIHSGIRRKMGNFKYKSIFLNVAISLIRMLAIFLQFHWEFRECNIYPQNCNATSSFWYMLLWWHGVISDTCVIWILIFYKKDWNGYSASSVLTKIDKIRPSVSYLIFFFKFSISLSE